MAAQTYGLPDEAVKRKVPAPELPYQPRDPRRYHPPIGLIGCGGITQSHLRAYKAAGYNIVALCDLARSRAEDRRREFYPHAAVYTDFREVLRRGDIEVVDITTHPQPRVAIITAALTAGKHVLSQKPFVLDLDVGRRLVDLARRKKVCLAVNQNGRWAPHFSYIRQAVHAGLLGRIIGAHLDVHWNHGWVAGTPFDQIRHVILYDFAIHWFDVLTQILPDRSARRVFASLAHAPGQKAKSPLLAQALIEYDDAQASLIFDASTPLGWRDRTYIAGTEGSLESTGPDLNRQRLTLWTKGGIATPRLRGAWFPDGFHGTMAELLCAIEEKREPQNNAADNLRSLALCFAAMRSADTGQCQVPGRVRRITL